MSGTPPAHGRNARSVLALALPVVLAGCSFDVQVAPTPTAPSAATDPSAVVSKDALARQLTDELARQTGHQTGQVSCPGDLPLTTGATVRCDVLEAGQRRGTVTAMINDQGRINYFFDIVASTGPAPAPGPGR